MGYERVCRDILSTPSDLVFCYDGGLFGFYCCVHACFALRRLPLAIQPDGAAQTLLFPERRVETDADAAQRVRASIREKISPRALELVESVFLSCLFQKEMALLRFLLLGYQDGLSVMQKLPHPDVAALLEAERGLLREAHLLTGFVRFSDFGGKLAATIRPKNFVLPFLAGHFSDRFSQETFIIYDRTHGAALLHENGRVSLVQMEGFSLPEADETEERYRALWRRFHRTLSIEARKNPVCQRTHMPKRFWSEMTEMRDLL